MTKLKQRLENPFALVAQGFVVGVILFWTLQPGESFAQERSQPVVAAAVR